MSTVVIRALGAAHLPVAFSCIIFFVVIGCVWLHVVYRIAVRCKHVLVARESAEHAKRD